MDDTEQRHETIWLQPWCDHCDRILDGGDGRQWCKYEVWGPCEECGRKPVKYVIAPPAQSGKPGER
jgi:hypothetical protein